MRDGENEAEFVLIYLVPANTHCSHVPGSSLHFVAFIDGLVMLHSTSTTKYLDLDIEFFMGRVEHGVQ